MVRILRSIAMTEENEERLSKVENVSKLINDLLDIHFRNNLTKKEEVIKDIESTKEEYETGLKKLHEEMNFKMKKLDEIKEKEDEEKAKELKKQHKAKEFEESVRSSFKMLCGEDMTDEEFLTYKQGWDDNTVTNLPNFIRGLGKMK